LKEVQFAYADFQSIYKILT